MTSRLYFFLFILVALLCGCGSDAPAKPAAPPEQRAVQTAPVQFRNVASELAIPASVQPDPTRVVHVFAPVSGRLVSLEVHAGDAVKAGQAVAMVQSSDAASARSDYDKAKVQAEHSQSVFRRAEVLYQHEVIAAKDLEDAKAQEASDKSDLERARQRLQMLGLSESVSSDKVTVRAPRSGIVIETTSAAGEFSKSLDASNPLMTIADLSSVWIMGNVYERDLAMVSPGAKVTVTADAYPSQTWQGKIAKISDVVDPTTRTLKARVVLENSDHRLKPDMFGAIHVARPSTQVAVVPASALLHEGNDIYVIIEKAKDKYERRAVQVQQSGASEALVRSGLQPGDVVVVSGAGLLREEASK